MLKALRLTLYLLCFGLLLSFPTLNHAVESDPFLSNSESNLTPAPANPLPQHETASPADPVTAALVSELSTISPGHPFWLAIQLKFDPHWHAYWKNPGDAGMAPMVSWQLPEGFSVGSMLWPAPKRFALSSMVGFGYEEGLTLLVQITPPDTHSDGPVDIGAEVRWLVCSDSACLPGESQTALTLMVSQQPPVADQQQSALFSHARAQIPKENKSLTAHRKQNLVELSFSEHAFIKHADFFPEHQKSIDYSIEPLFQTQPNSQHKHTLILKETTPNASLKGVLVLHTTAGMQTYDVDVAINDPHGNANIVMHNNHATAINDTLFKQHADASADDNFEFEGGLALALVLAFIGGLILNLMPCVLPVISFKVLSFIKMAGESRRLIFQHGLAFAGGVLLSFWVLAALLLSLQAYGRSVGWGFQLQEPIFVAMLAALLFVFALSLFGLFEIGTSLISAAGQAQHRSGQRNALVGSFFSGILATAVATPCTGPFLGSAVGYAVTLPPLQAMLIFTSLGLGMSLPYLLLAAFPRLLSFMPKPGAWMITFKELMGFCMLATVLWLVWVFSAQTSSLAVSVLLAGFFLLAFAGWIYGKWATPLSKRLTRSISTFAALSIFICGGYVIGWAAYAFSDEPPAHTQITEQTIADAWESFSPERVAELRQNGTPVFVDFTSKWCLICQANHMVLSMDDVTDKFKALGVVKMKADWTRRDAVITAELRKYGRNSVPLYILYSANADTPPQILPQILTPEVIALSLKELEGAK